jgi:hypothetical protein
MCARPARLGLLVPTSIQGASWARLFESALAAQTRFWGGSGNLIFPLTLDLTDHALFWALADLFDADAYVTYAPTWREVEGFAPGYYAATMTSLRERMTGQQFDTTTIEEFISEQYDRQAFELRPTDAQLDLLKRRLAPFHHNASDGWVLDWFNSTEPVAWPFTDVAEFVDLPNEISNPVSPAGVARKLLLTAVAGRVPHGLNRVLAEREVAVHQHPIRGSHQWASLVLDRPRGEQRPTYPWMLSDYGLALYRRGGWRRDPATLVVGNSPWDFTLFYALKRMTGMAWWLPTWLIGDSAYLLSLGAALQYDARGGARHTVVVSASSTEARDRAVGSINRLSAHDFSLEAADWWEVLPEEPLRLYERDNEGRTEMVQLVDGATLPLDTPLLRRTRTIVPAEMRWITEAQGHEWTPVRHHTLGTRLLEGISTASELIRMTRDGVAYFSTGMLILGGASLESSIVRPMLRPLVLVDQVRAILEPLGWDCDMSDKGVYAHESMALFGGFEELCVALRDPYVRAIVDAYRNRSAPGRSLSHDDRRYLTWESFKTILNDQQVAETIDPLRSRGILVRGLVLKCSRCRQEAWHHAAAVGETFTCGRCHLQQPADRRSWLGGDEPVWSYRMAEVLYQFLEHDGDLRLC